MKTLKDFKYKPYSHSKIEKYKQCPKAFDFRYVSKVKIPFEPQIHLEKGSFIHLVLELFVQGKINSSEEVEFDFTTCNEEQILEIKELSNSLISLPYFKKLKNMADTSFKVMFEHHFGYDANMKPLNSPKYNECLYQGYIDLLILINKETAVVIDYKTGKYKEPRWQKYDQVASYACWCMLEYETVKTVKGIFLYVEAQKTNSTVYDRDMVSVLRNNIFMDIQEIEESEKFDMKPSKLCDWCDYKKFGHCEPNN